MTMTFLSARLLSTLLLAAAASLHAQTPAPAAAADVKSIASMSWLYGCWGGTVNQRDFREQWMPLRGGMLLGIGSTVFQDKVQSYEYLRLESRPDGVFYVAVPSDQKEAAFKLTSINITEDNATEYVFDNPAHDFPQRITYRRGSEGWLYATIEGKLKGEERKVVYPMRRVDCESGEFIRQ
jgi:hypothetical protein